MLKKTTITLTLALLCAVTAFAQTQQKQTPPAVGAPRNFAIPEIRRFDLPNGLKVRLVQYGEVPKVTVRLVTRPATSMKRRAKCGSPTSPAR
jgi:hypothetical protein